MKTYQLDCYFYHIINVYIYGICSLMWIGSGIFDFLSTSDIFFPCSNIILGLLFLLLFISCRIGLPICYHSYSITVDKKELCFIFSESKKYYIEFSNIKSVHIIKNPALFRNPTWLVNIKTYKGGLYSMAIPAAVMNDFYSDLSEGCKIVTSSTP